MSVPDINSTKYELENYYSKITRDIENLQEIQKHVGYNINSEDEDSIKERIDKLVEERNNLYDRLEIIYKSSRDDLTRNRKVLKDQVAIVGILDHELNRTKTNVSRLETDKANKLRLIEITNYESSRYKSYMEILKYIIYSSILIIIIYFIKERFGYLIPGRVVTLSVILVIGVTVVLVGKSIYDLMIRDNRVFDRYNYNQAYNKNMTAERSENYLTNEKYSSGNNRVWLENTGSGIVEGMMNYKTDPNNAQKGTIVPGVESVKDTENYLHL